MPEFELKSVTRARWALVKTDILVVLAGDDGPADNSPVGRACASASAHGDFSTKAGTLLSLYGLPDVLARRVLLAGAGDGSPRAVRQAVLAALGSLKGVACGQLTIAWSGSSGAATEALILAVAEATYQYVHTRSKPKAGSAVVFPASLEKVTLAVPDRAAVREDFDRAVALAHGVGLAREWGNRPGNHATPTLLAAAARQLARDHGLSCEVLGPREISRLGMGAFEAVARGSEEPLRFIVLRYQGAGRSQAPVVLVGKGITFDTGGISIKPAAEMDEMKFDMCGAASVLGTFRALAELKPAVNVVGLIPACENMPDGRAIKPGDVVTSMDGQTIEILNTDAEGRLILCDALAYARRFKPAAVVDIATLTGACVIALGGVRSGLFSPDDALADELFRAGESAMDPCWRMPLDDEYAEGLRTHFADVANVAGRAAGAVTAAKFLQRFATDLKWAHLDIAGSAWKSGAAKGATGRPVGLLTHFVLSRAGVRKAARARAKA